ncbi:unnamed protein product [Urochloa decumbens]|uniref:Initiation factor eIF2 gamma C-terminal domain-containing protein n=1 Tax=Urochloa decumbens TaxID=240449 RepID=A0ABC9GHY8_9POAL
MARRGLMEQGLSKLDVTKLHPLSPEVISRQATINIGIDATPLLINSSLHGVMRVNQKIEVRPGIVMKDENGNIKCTPIYSRIVSLCAEQNELQFAVPGGLIGVGTTMDPTLTRADRLAGQVLGEVGSLPDVYVELEINFFLLWRLLGVKKKGTEKAGKVSKLTKGEILMLNIGSMSTGTRVLAVKNDLAKLQLTAPVCTSKGEKKIQIPKRNFTSPPNMIVIRSFDVNKPGSEVDEIRGGVAGGIILRKIEVRPGIVMKDENGNIKCTPIYSRIVSLCAEQNELQFAVPGGLIGVGTTMDPTLTRADRLAGQVLGEVGSLPDVYVELEINFFLLWRLLGVKKKGTEKAGKVSKLTKGEILMLNIGSMSTGTRVLAVKNDLAKLQLTAPVCTSKGEKVALSRRVEKHWRLIGWGQIQAGSTLEVPPCPL